MIDPPQWFAKSKKSFRLALHATFKSVTFTQLKDPHTLDEYFRDSEEMDCRVVVM